MRAWRLVLLAPVLLGACHAVTQIDSFTVEGCPVPLDMQREFRVSMSGMEFHSGNGHPLHLWAQDTCGETTAAFVLEPVPSPNFSLVFPEALLASEHVVQFFADVNGDGHVTTQGAEVDHRWVRPLGFRETALNFEHTGTFENVEIPYDGNRMRLQFRNASSLPMVARVMDIRVIEPADPQRGTRARLVGYYRVSASALRDASDRFLEANCRTDACGLVAFFDLNADGTRDTADPLLVLSDQTGRDTNGNRLFQIDVAQFRTSTACTGDCAVAIRTQILSISP